MTDHATAHRPQSPGLLQGDAVTSSTRPIAPDPGLLPLEDFPATAHAVLQDPRHRVGMSLWMITRTVGDHQVVLQAHDPADHYGVGAGTVLDWHGSLCAAMVAGRGPHIAARVADESAYAAAPNREQHPIEAFIGIPLLRPDGSTFGTLCAFDPHPQPATLTTVEPHVQLQARLLSTVLQLELTNDQQRRRAERAEIEANTDALTGLANRRGWDQVLHAEEARCRRYAHPAAVIVVDLNDLKTVNDTHGHAAGDTLLRTAAEILRQHARTSDYLARLGGDEFGIVLVETDPTGAHAAATRLREALAAADLHAALGVADRTPVGSLLQSWHQADQAMYRDKRTA